MSLAFGLALPHWYSISGGAFSPASLFAGGVNGAWYDPSDLTTMFTTSAGTTPVAIPGQGSAVSVGLMLDKSQGLVLGSELVTNGDFNTNVSGWTLADVNASITWVSGGFANVKMLTNTGSGAYQDVLLATGTRAKISIRARKIGASGNTDLVIHGNGAFTTTLATTTITSTSFQTYDFIVPAFAGGFRVYLKVVFAGAEMEVDSVSVRELPGNHAISINDSTARPELSARVNLLTYSEQFENAVWTKQSVTISADQTTAPDGTNTADLMYPASSGAWRELFRNITSGTLTLSVYAKASGKQWLYIGVSTADSATNFAWFDVGSGVVGTKGSGVTSSAIQSVGSGWYKCTIQTSVAGAYVIIGLTDADNSSNVTVSGTSGIYIWGADLRPANIGAAVPAYQRIADANTYDTAGFPLYLRFDGVDDGMYTPANLNLSATDKATVFAGVRKLSDAAAGVVAELTDLSTNAGAFSLFAGSTTATRRWAWSIAAAQNFIGTSDLVAPSTAVMSAIMDRAASTAQNKLGPRLNGATPTLSEIVPDSLVGNFANSNLFIGSRNNGSLWLQGQVYGLVVVGSAVSAGNISATESWMAGKTGLSL